MTCSLCSGSFRPLSPFVIPRPGARSWRITSSSRGATQTNTPSTAVMAAALPLFSILSHPRVPLTTGRGQDHGLQHLRIKLVVGPGAGFITILGAGETVTWSGTPQDSCAHSPPSLFPGFPNLVPCPHAKDLFPSGGGAFI